MQVEEIITSSAPFVKFRDNVKKLKPLFVTEGGYSFYPLVIFRAKVKNLHEPHKLFIRKSYLTILIISAFGRELKLISNPNLQPVTAK